MKQTLTIEVIMNPGFSGASYMDYNQEQAEQKWLSVLMLSIANSEQPKIERVYLDCINQMADFCLS
ncbi:MAG: hypothetical protein EPN92_05210 [Chitinophagaceae bacterium]|nr:MAG: hypothetical protein EPN92_05210 [Chitinophagaceae bacterium]